VCGWERKQERQGAKHNEKKAIIVKENVAKFLRLGYGIAAGVYKRNKNVEGIGRQVLIIVEVISVRVPLLRFGARLRCRF
jgi:hypothetical protein